MLCPCPSVHAGTVFVQRLQELRPAMLSLLMLGVGAVVEAAGVT